HTRFSRDWSSDGALPIYHRPVPHLRVGLGAGDLRGLLLEERRGPVGDEPGDELVVQRLIHGAVGEGALQGGVLGERLGDREEARSEERRAGTARGWGAAP